MQTAQLQNFEIGMTKDARFDTKINTGLKELLKSASILEGMDLSSFVIGAAAEKAREILQQAESLTLNHEEYKNFLSSINKPAKATTQLKSIMALDDLDER